MTPIPPTSSPAAESGKTINVATPAIWLMASNIPSGVLMPKLFGLLAGTPLRLRINSVI